MNSNPSTASVSASSPLASPRRRVLWWRWAAPAALLLAGGAYLAVSLAQSDQPYLDQPIGWISRPVFSSNDLSSGKEVVFRPEFNKTSGHGSLIAKNVNANGDVLSTSPWTDADAGVLLKTQDAFTGRRIFTVNSATKAAVPFVWGSLSSDQQAALGDATQGPKVLGFLRGDTTNEGNGAGQFRIRPSPLGAIVHSTVARWNHFDSAGKMHQRLYVGANDGMLHAFDAATGKELFAYVPSMLVPRLSALAEPGYKAQAYVDGPLSVANIGDTSGTKTMLVGGLGGGGQGLFALDVSATAFDSDADAAKTLKWEVTPASTGFANLGFTYAIPTFARLENGTAVVIVGNGYGSSSGKASLLVIDAFTGVLLKEIDTGVGSAGSPNGLSSPTLLDTNGNNRVDTAYAGDLQGNVWKFDLSTAVKSLLFTTSPVQAITTAPALRRHPVSGQLVIFGTGKALIDADLLDKSVHAIYGIWDGAPGANNSLLEQTVTEMSIDGKRWRSTSSDLITWQAVTTTGNTTLHKGWKLTLPAGERLLGESPFVSDNRFVFGSMNPTTPSGTGVGPGENWMTQISVFNGGSPTSSIFDVNNDGSVNDSDKSDADSGSKVINGRYMADGVVSQPVLTDMSGLSRTVFNYNPEIAVTVISTPGETTTTTTTDTQVTTTPPLNAPGGVSNGHFDVDIFYGGRNPKHVHEYDDKYNVVGVNFLSPSEKGFDIANGIENAATEFKVLAINQYLNPASLLRVGGGGYVQVKDFQGQASATNSSFVGSLPIYRRNDIGSFIWKLPVDGFQSKDWWGDGGVQRAGLIPTQTGCVNKGFSKTPGPNGEIYNGAFTLQLIKPETPATALELNYPAGGPKYGWRVKSGQRTAYVLTEYTLFWHHENKKCYGENGWIPNAPQDTTNKAGGKPPSGTNDPTATPNPNVDGPVSVVNTVVVVNGNVKTTTLTYSDGSTKTTRETTTTTGNSTPGSIETVLLDRNGNKVTGGKCIGGVNTLTGQPCVLTCPDGTTLQPCSNPPEDPFQDGRFNWRELRNGS